MPDLIIRKQRLRMLENEIRDGLLEGAEAFYYVGMKLKEIKDDELWDTEGFASWNKYILSGRLEMSASHVKRHIQSAAYRQKIGLAQNLGERKSGWSHWAFEQLTRVPLEQAPRVAKKIEAQAEKKGVALTGSFVREIVTKELDRPPRQPKP